MRDLMRVLMAGVLSSFFSTAHLAAENELRQCMEHQPRAQHDPLLGHWTGQVVHGTKKWRIELDVQASGANQSVVALVDFLDLNAYGRRFSGSLCDSAFRLERPQPSGIPIVFQGRVAGDSTSGTWQGFWEDAAFALRRTGPAPTPVTVQAIRFRNGDVELRGSLFLPEGAGPFPALVEIHGGGAESRGANESKGLYFARHGVAVLTYDKRGVGESTGDWGIASLQDLAGDAAAAVRLLKARSDINPASIGVDGYSQGGWIAPITAIESADVAFVVVGSASGVNPMAQSIYQVRNEMRAAGDADSIIDLAVTLRERMYAAPSGPARREVSADLQRYRGEPWFGRSSMPDSLSSEVLPGIRQMFLFDPSSAWQRVHVPVLGYWGQADLHLPAERSREIISHALALGGNRDTTFVIYPEADHSMSRLTSGIGGWDFPRAYDTYSLILHWVERRFNRAAMRPS